MKYHIIKINEKFGCKDDDDSWILMPEYEKLEISNNCVICKKEDKVQIYNLNEKSFLLECEKVREDKGGYWAFYSEGKWGVLSTCYNNAPRYDNDCYIIISNDYNDVKQLNEGLYSVQNNDKYQIQPNYGPLDECLRFIDAHPIYYNDHRLLAKKNNKYGFTNYKTITTIPFIYDEIKERKEKKLFDVRIGGAWGILSLDGREIVQVKYSEVVFKKYSNIIYNPNYFNYNDTWHEYFDIVEDVRSKRKGVIDREGKELIPPIYNYINILSRNMLKDWESLLPKIYHEKYSDLGMFFFEASEVIGENYLREKTIISGLFDALGNLVVPIEYTSFDFNPQGYIMASYDNCFYDIYNIREYGKRLVNGINKISVDTKKERYYLFETKFSFDIDEDINKEDNEEIIVYTSCVPVDFSFRTILKNSAGESLQLDSNIALSDIPEPFKISLGNIIQRNFLWEYSAAPPTIYNDSIIVRRGKKEGIYYLKTQSYSSLYDDCFPQVEPDLFIVKAGKRYGLLLKGQEILQPIYWGISTVCDGFCFIIKEDYSHFDIDIINVYDIENSHIAAFSNLSKDDVLNICNNKYLVFKTKENKVCFNKQCPYPMTEEFSRFISTETITTDRVPNWEAYVYGPDD